MNPDTPPFDRARSRRYGADAVVLNEGESTDTIFLVESGMVEVTVQAENGSETVLGFLGHGDIFGEMRLFPETISRTATVRALVPTTVRISRVVNFLSASENDPAIWRELAGQLASRLRQTNHRFGERSIYGVKERIAHLLAELAAGGPGVEGSSAEVKIKRGVLGRLTGSSREAASRALSELAREDLVQLNGQTISLPDVVVLRDYRNPSPGD